MFSSALTDTTPHGLLTEFGSFLDSTQLPDLDAGTMDVGYDGGQPAADASGQQPVASAKVAPVAHDDDAWLAEIDDAAIMDAIALHPDPDSALPPPPPPPPPPVALVEPPGFLFETWVLLFNVLCTRAYTAGDLLGLVAPSLHGTCMYQKSRDAACCGEKVRRPNCRLQEPHRASLCPSCRRASDGQPRYSPTAGSTVTFLDYSLPALEHVLACADRDQLNATLGALGGGFGIAKDRINRSNSRNHLVADEASHKTHLFGLAGKIADRRLVRLFDSDVKYATIICPVTREVRHYAIERLHGVADGMDVEGIPVAMRIA